MIDIQYFEYHFEAVNWDGSDEVWEKVFEWYPESVRLGEEIVLPNEMSVYIGEWVRNPDWILVSRVQGDDVLEHLYLDEELVIIKGVEYDEDGS